MDRSTVGRSWRPLLVIAVAALVAAGVAGCFEAGPGDRFGTPPKPGLIRGSLDNAEAVGYVVHETELEGGFWALMDQPLGTSSAVQPKVVAVLVPGTGDEGSYAKLEGRLVWVGGRVAEGASIRMAGPELKVDGIEPIDTP